jgi:hypothetical protein
MYAALAVQEITIGVAIKIESKIIIKYKIQEITSGVAIKIK